MSLRSAMLNVANTIRGIPSKTSLDVWPTRVAVRTRTWLGGAPGADGGFTDVDLPIVPTPRVRELSQEEIRGSGGRYLAGDVMVEHITPAHIANPGVGFTQVQLDPRVRTNDVQTIYVLTGEIAGNYSLVNLTVEGSITYTLQLRRMRSTP